MKSLSPDRLRSIAKDNKLEPDWMEATKDYKTWASDFLRSPIRKILSGKNATDIMGPLTGKTAEQVKTILSKYTDQGFDPQAVSQEAKRAAIAQTISRFSRPSKWDVILSGMALANPAYGVPGLAARVAVPWALRHPGVLDAVAGEGLKKIPVGKVALKAAQAAQGKP